MNPSEQQPEKAKLVVDEDWKARAQAEKEALQKAREQSQQAPFAPKEAAGGEPPAPSEDAASAEPANEDSLFDFPPASFVMLVGELGTQALYALDEAVKSQGNKRTNLLNAARHAIDTLDVLEIKCKGNLTADEQTVLSRYLQAARLAYVQASSRKA